MKKNNVILLMMIILIITVSCDVNKYKENSWYSNEKLQECLVKELPKIQNVDFVNKNGEDIYFYMNESEFNLYINKIYNYLKSQNFKYLGTKGDTKESLAGMLSTYYFKEADLLEDFKSSKYDGSDYIFVYSDGTEDSGEVVFNIIKFYIDDNSILEYKNKEFKYNTQMMLRHYSEYPLGGIPVLKE